MKVVSGEKMFQNVDERRMDNRVTGILLANQSVQMCTFILLYSSQTPKTGFLTSLGLYYDELPISCVLISTLQKIVPQSNSCFQLIQT